jgi:hypothetical protein
MIIPGALDPGPVQAAWNWLSYWGLLGLKVAVCLVVLGRRHGWRW